MITIYELDAQHIYTGQSRDIAPEDGRPLGWVAADAQPPEGVAQWVGGSWVVLQERPTVAQPSASVPATVSPRQIRQAMNRAPLGEATLRDAVEAAVAAGDRDLRDWWEFSTVVERSNPQVVVMATALGLGDAALDDLWRLAATL